MVQATASVSDTQPHLRRLLQHALRAHPDQRLFCSLCNHAIRLADRRDNTPGSQAFPGASRSVRIVICTWAGSIQAMMSRIVPLAKTMPTEAIPMDLARLVSATGTSRN